MKTLHIFHHSDLLNGVDKTTCILIRALKGMGHTPIAIVPQKGDVTKYLTKYNIQFYILPYSCCESKAERAALLFLADSFTQYELLHQLMKTLSPDVVHINTGHLLHAGLAAAYAGIPAIWHIHSPFEEDLQRYQNLIGQQGYVELLTHLSTLLLAVSSDINDSLATFLPQDRIKTLFNGVDVEELEEVASLSQTAILDELHLPSHAKLVIGVGRISAQKDFASFARVAAQVIQSCENAFFIIAGPQQEQAATAELERQIMALDLSKRVFLLGPRSDIPSLLAQSSCFLSTAMFEGHPIATLEAMALNTPVVAMACQGLRECVQSGIDGLLVPLGDEVAAAQAVIQILNDPELAHRIGHLGRQTVITRFSSTQYAEQFLHLAKDAVKLGPASITSSELGLMTGLLKQINNAHQRLLRFERQTRWQRFKGLCRDLLPR